MGRGTEWWLIVGFGGFCSFLGQSIFGLAGTVYVSQSSGLREGGDGRIVYKPRIDAASRRSLGDKSFVYHPHDSMWRRKAQWRRRLNKIRTFTQRQDTFIWRAKSVCRVPMRWRRFWYTAFVSASSEVAKSWSRKSSVCRVAQVWLSYDAWAAALAVKASQAAVLGCMARVSNTYRCLFKYVIARQDAWCKRRQRHDFWNSWVGFSQKADHSVRNTTL